MMPHEKLGKVAWRAIAKVPADPSGVAQECVGQVLALVDTRPHDVPKCWVLVRVYVQQGLGKG